MLHLDDNSIIYVVCPANKKTGGTELAHQLVRELLLIGRKAYITYYGADGTGSPINPAFLEYVDTYKLVSDIEDSPSNVVVTPEIYFELIRAFTHVQKVIWWMSVDNYVKNDGFLGALSVVGLKKALRGVASGRLTLRRKGVDTSALHLYQSAYAREYLKKIGAEESARLSDYINDSYLEPGAVPESGERKDAVLYNPKKGIKFTKKLMEKAPELEWIPIQNMTTQQVRDLLGKSKVYIDFGNHPGKDRFPREAAIMGCCVITGKRGSAGYFDDIPISDEFKFSESGGDVDRILAKIKTCLADYDSESKKFDDYKKMISQEHERFRQDVRTIFG